MPEIDDFAALLLEEAKRFLENARAIDDSAGSDAYLHAALMLGFSALEAHVNAVCEEFSTRPELSAHERALLLEMDVKLENGEFKLSGFRMSRLEERMTFVHRRFSGKAPNKNAPWSAALGSALELRNRLTHPKSAPVVSVDEIERALGAIIEAIDALYQAIYKKKFPAASRGLHSRLTF